MKESIFIALGSNLGYRWSNLRTARDALVPEVQVVKASTVYITTPWGFEDQPDFLNQVLEVRTSLEPLVLLQYLKTIETKMGRKESFRNGPRLIDLDILFYGKRVIDTMELHIPHPHLQERAFVLVPLNEIAPDFIHPVFQKSVEDLLEEIDKQGVRYL
jgi:2-amino-4-hydroxy-6-hydroxymethyldihydropteridine diphosphokinase